MTSYFSLGLMSGSSLDGLDICYSRIDYKSNSYSFEIIHAETISYPIEILTKLKAARAYSDLDLKSFDLELGTYFGRVSNEFILKHNILLLDFISSHGHTIYHYPEKGITKQIGNGDMISKLTNITVFSNLRQRDIDAGGSGAPIVPIGDLLFFSDYKYCLNLGGIMNITSQTSSELIAFDIGSCNQIINHYSNQLGFEMDRDGNIAKSGSCNEALVNKLNDFSFFKKNPPKSLDNSFSEKLIDCIDSFSLNINDSLNSFYHHLGFQLASVIKNKSDLILCTGGGARNKFMMSLFKETFNLNIYLTSEEIIDYKEALVMSLMGVRFFENKFNVLASVTGANMNTICGDKHQYSIDN